MSRLFTLPLPALLVLGALTTGCNRTEEPIGGELDPRVLYGFESCDDMLGYTKARANELIDEYGNIHGYDYSQGWGWGSEDGGAVTTGGSAGESDSGGDPGGEPSGDGDDNGGGGGKDYSGTNVQEAGVDEPDLIKTDGDRILAFARGKLHFVDTSGATPTLRGSLAVAQDVWEAQMFLHENRVLLLARTWPYYYGGEGLPGVEQGIDLQQYFGADFYDSVLRMVEIDISDPDNLKIVSNLYLTGDLVSARMVEGVSRVVVRSNPHGLQWKSPDEFFDYEGYQAKVGDNWNEALYQAYWDQAVAKAKLHNHEVVDGSKAENWVPRFVHEDLSGNEAKLTSGLLLGCDKVMHPGEYSGLSMLSVLTVDLNANLVPGGGVGIFSEGETVYASKDNLYVATTPWNPENWNPDAEESQKGLTTYIHKFDIKARDASKYIASGSVRGWLLSQWALSEHNGDLRVASTDSLGWDNSTSESFVSVLRQVGDELTQIGQVGGLGKTEQIQGVRFIGDTGYVVTFRQTDPLYTVDVADPTNPAVVGELKIPGFSAYLHPIGENLLLGVGRDGTEEGQLLGLQLSVFDVSNKKSPTQLHKLSVGEEWGWSEALFDHKAFLWWGKTGLAMMPMEWSTWDEQTQTGTWEHGAFGFTVDKEDGIELVSQVEHPDPVVEECYDEYYGCGYWSPQLRRSMVIGDLVYTLSDVGLKASALAGLGDKHWIEFPQN